MSSSQAPSTGQNTNSLDLNQSAAAGVVQMSLRQFTGENPGGHGTFLNVCSVALRTAVSEWFVCDLAHV